MNKSIEQKILEHQKNFRCWFWTVTLGLTVAPILLIALLSCFCAESCYNKILTPLCVSVLSCGIIEIVRFGFVSTSKYKTEKEELCLKLLDLLTRIRNVSSDVKLHHGDDTIIKPHQKDQMVAATEMTEKTNNGWNDVYKLVEDILAYVYLFLESHSLFTMSDEYIEILRYCSQVQIFSQHHIDKHNYSELRKLYFKRINYQIPRETVSYTLRNIFENLKKEHDYIDYRNDFDTSPFPQYFFIDRSNGVVHSLTNLETKPPRKEEVLLKPEICIRGILTERDQKFLFFEILRNAFKTRECVLLEKS